MRIDESVNNPEVTFTRSNVTKKINAALEIVKLDHQRFTVPGGYIQPTGYAFKHPEYGYLGFKDRYGPYNPIGKKKALEDIIRSGGFLHFEDMVWSHPMPSSNINEATPGVKIT
jgi:hypothetical protein